MEVRAFVIPLYLLAHFINKKIIYKAQYKINVGVFFKNMMIWAYDGNRTTINTGLTKRKISMAFLLHFLFYFVLQAFCKWQLSWEFYNYDEKLSISHM